MSFAEHFLPRSARTSKRVTQVLGTRCSGAKASALRAALTVALTGLLISTGCQREKREFDSGVEVQLPVSTKSLHSSYEQNAFSLSQGKQLYLSFNCSGCHAHGGGGMGPALLDAPWRYGSELPQIFDSIMDGRPNGMPSFRGRITTQQAWQIAGYVRSLSGQISQSAAPSRSDHMKANPPENSVDPVTPRKENPPNSDKAP